MRTLFEAWGYWLLALFLLATLLMWWTLGQALTLEWDGNYGDPGGIQGQWNIKRSNACTGTYAIVQTQNVQPPVVCTGGANVGKPLCAQWLDPLITVPGATYCYVVTGIGTDGKESTPSNVLQFSVPSEPTPTNLRSH